MATLEHRAADELAVAAPAAPAAAAPAPVAAPPAGDGAAAQRAELRRFGLVVGGVFAALAAYLALRHRHPTLLYGYASLAALLLGGAALAPALLAPVRRAWMSGAAVLGWVNTRLLLSIAYILLVVPIALVLRALGRDPLDRRLERDRKSYWRDRPDEPEDRERYRRQY
jgi:hypothetical protein